MDKENVSNGHLDKHFRDGTSEAADQVGSNESPTACDLRLPNTRYELNDNAAQVNRATPVFVNKRHKENATNCQSTIAESGACVESVVRNSELVNQRSP